MPDSSGYLIIRAFAANQAIPVENADVEIFTSGASPPPNGLIQNRQQWAIRSVYPSGAAAAIFGFPG